MLKALTFGFLVTFASKAAAVCYGESYIDKLDDEQLSALAVSAADIPFGEGIVWQARKGNAVMTIVGAIQFYHPRLEPLRALLVEPLESSKRLLVETTPTQQTELAELIKSDPRRILMTDGSSLPEMLDDRTWQALLAETSSRGISAEVAARLQPWYLWSLLSVPDCAKDATGISLRGLDSMLMSEAERLSIPLQSVEPTTGLLDVLTNIPMQQQADFLTLFMMPDETRQALYVASMDAYSSLETGMFRELNRHAMLKNVGDDDAKASEIFDNLETTLLASRNQNWIPVMTEAAQVDGEIMVAVGAAHLIGEEGILQLLVDDGWDVTRLP